MFNNHWILAIRLEIVLEADAAADTTERKGGFPLQNLT